MKVIYVIDIVTIYNLDCIASIDLCPNLWLCFTLNVMLWWFCFECKDAMESTDPGPAAERILDSVYLRRHQDSANGSVSLLQSTHGSFHLSQVPYISVKWIYICHLPKVPRNAMIRIMYTGVYFNLLQLLLETSDSAVFGWMKTESSRGLHFLKWL